VILWLLAFTCLYGFFKKVDVYDAFVQGAKEGLHTVFQILPYLSVTLIGVHLLRDCGLLERIYTLVSPFVSTIGLTEGVVPLLLIRPFSGSAALAVLSDILHQYGADSRTGLLASTLMGSGETVFYTCALYLAAAKVKRSRYIIPVALVSWFAGCCVAGLFFR